MTSGCLSFLNASLISIPATFSTKAISFPSNKLNHKPSSCQHQIWRLRHLPHPPCFVRETTVAVSVGCSTAMNKKAIGGDQMLVRELNFLVATLKPWNSLQFDKPSRSAGASVRRILIPCSASIEDGAASKGTVYLGSAEDCPIPLTVGVEAENVRVQSRRSFYGACLLFGLAALPVSCHGDEAKAVAAANRQGVMKEAPSPFDENRLLQQNRRMQKLNGAPDGFPGFVREGFDVKVLTDERYVTTKTGLIYFDLVEGHGEPPQDGQQVIFHYIGYNESGRRVDSSYQQGQPARTRVGINGMIPGFEEGIKSMRIGGKRRIIIPPDLGPPVGPSTFFSAKQFEVFDVELLDVKSCERRTVFLYSDVVCE